MLKPTDTKKTQKTQFPTDHPGSFGTPFAFLIHEIDEPCSQRAARSRSRIIPSTAATARARAHCRRLMRRERWMEGFVGKRKKNTHRPIRAREIASKRCDVQFVTFVTQQPPANFCEEVASQFVVAQTWWDGESSVTTGDQQASRLEKRFLGK